MQTIFLNSNNEALDLDSFEEKMIQICNEHRKEDRALAFAFILYDFENPHVLKILNDRDYWLALNAISGKYLTIFSLNYNEKKWQQWEDSRHIEMTTNISTIQNPSEGAKVLIEKYFGNVEIRYPAILFFQVDNKSVIDSLLIDLKEEYIQLAFLELKEYITHAVISLKRITPENKKNIHEIFNCLANEIKHVKTIRNVYTVLQNE